MSEYPLVVMEIDVPIPVCAKANDGVPVRDTTSVPWIVANEGEAGGVTVAVNVASYTLLAGVYVPLIVRAR